MTKTKETTDPNSRSIVRSAVVVGFLVVLWLRSSARNGLKYLVGQVRLNFVVGFVSLFFRTFVATTVSFGRSQKLIVDDADGSTVP